MINKEENNYPKAIAISAGVMALFIAVSFFIIIGSFEPEKTGIGGIVVNYGSIETGIGNDYTSIEEPSVNPNANNQALDKVLPEQEVILNKTSQESTNKEIQTQNMEDALVINAKQQSNSVPTISEETKTENTRINQNALYKGKQKSGIGAGDGIGDQSGNQGSTNGDSLSQNYGDGGLGYGNNPIPLSRFNDIKTVDDNGQQTGKIVVKIRVNFEGKVIYALAGARGTTFTDEDLYRKCEQAVLGATLNKMYAGYENRTFIVVFNFRVK